MRTHSIDVGFGTVAAIASDHSGSDMQPVAECDMAVAAAQAAAPVGAALREPAAEPAAQQQVASWPNAAVVALSPEATAPRSPTGDPDASEAADREVVRGGTGSADSEDGGDATDKATEDIRACLFSLLQRKCPELRITCNALGMLEGLLDQILQKVLAEALQQPEAAPGGDPEPLTSLAIQKAVKQLLPNEQLPAAALKNSWHLDKQSLRGIKRRRAVHEVHERKTQAPGGATAASGSKQQALGECTSY